MNQLPHHEKQKKWPDQFIEEIGEVLVHAHAQRIVEGTTQGVMNFAEYLHAARTSLPYSHCEFALRLGLHEAQLVAMEQGLLPRSAISAELLRRIAHLVDEEEEILLLILDGATPGLHHQPVVNRLWSGIHYPGRKRTRFTTLLKNYVELQKWTGNYYLFRHFTSILIGSNRLYRNVERAFGAVRNWRLAPPPWNGFSSLQLSRAATVFFSLLLLYWFVVDADAPTWQLPSLRNQQGVNTNVIAQIDDGDARINRTSVDLHGAGTSDNSAEHRSADAPQATNRALVAAPTRSTALATTSLPKRVANVHAIYPAYEIIYVSPSSLIDSPVQAYIEVKDQEFAVIHFLTSTTHSSRRCVSSGRFDLCPI